MVDVSDRGIFAHAIVGFGMEKIETASTIPNRPPFQKTCPTNVSISSVIEELLKLCPKEVIPELEKNIILSGPMVEGSNGESIRNEFNTNSHYEINITAHGEEATKGAILFSKLPNFKDYCSLWYEQVELVSKYASFV